MQRTTMDDLGGQDAKRFAPATERNRDAIAETLAAELPDSGLILEVASGTGEHALHFARRFPDLTWQPSDPDSGALLSIAAWREEHEGSNLLPPMKLDASGTDWQIESADGIVCINMVHISPWEATEGLFAGAERLLGEGAPLVLYGPYIESAVETASSNLQFDESLKSRDARWGLRKVEDMDVLAKSRGFVRSARHSMPANNIVLVYRKTG